MPKYTSPQTISSTTTITSADWNRYFGSIGNLQWVYDSYENVSALNAVSLENATVPATAQNVVSRITNYAQSYGDATYSNKSFGVLTSPINTGYVYLSATVSHAESITPIYYIQFVPLHESHHLLTTSFVSLKRQVNTNVGVYPVVRTGSNHAIYYVRGGFTRFQLAVYRSDAAITTNTFTVDRFALLPLSDVSGLVNFFDNAVVIE